MTSLIDAVLFVIGAFCLGAVVDEFSPLAYSKKRKAVVWLFLIVGIVCLANACTS